MNYHTYVIGTIFYGLFALLGILGLIFFVLTQQWFLVLISVAVIYVALDNFFCGSHLKKCGVPVKTHYVIPPWVKFWK